MRNKTIDPNAKATGPLKREFRRSPEWKEFCQSFKELRDHTCEICGKRLNKGQAQVHHRINAVVMRDYMTLTNDRFLLCCSTCHRYLHIKCNSPYLKKNRWYVKPNEW